MTINTEKITIQRNALLRLMKTLGWMNAPKRNNEMLLDMLHLIPDVAPIEDPELSMDKADLRLLLKIKRGMEAKAEFEVVS